MKKLHDIKAVIFDLDGVITDTSRFHAVGWKATALAEDIELSDKELVDLRGIGRNESLEIILRKKYTEKYIEEYFKPSGKFAELADKKNIIYLKCIEALSTRDIFPGVPEFIEELKKLGIKVAVASGSKNTPFILNKLGLDKTFDAVVHGGEVSKSKPDPELFLTAAERLNIPPKNCVVIEDAASGIAAAKAGGMKTIGAVEGLDADLILTGFEGSIDYFI